MARRAGVNIQTTTYGRFKGVDFSTDASLVESYRAPQSVNMIADTGGMPEKRVGWRTICRVSGAVNGLFSAAFEGKTKFLIHGGAKIYTWTPGVGEPAEAKDAVFDGPSAAVFMAGKLWVLTGGEYLVWDGETVRDVSEIAYIPTTVIGANPKGGGTPFESINLMQKKRRNEFIPDGSSKVYQLDGVELCEDAVTCTVRGEEKTEGTDFTVDRAKGTVTFTTAPTANPVGQEGSVVITFSKGAEGRGEKAGKCSVITTYGVGSSDRVVISGNPDYPNVDWTSAWNDPSYIPDLSYAVVGTEATTILGYRRIGEYLAIVKEDNGQDSTVFLRSAGLSPEGEAVFPVKQSIAGVGAVSKRGFGNILDEQLFLSRTGVYALTTNALTAERIVQNRSFFVDNRLTREPGLERAAAVAWNGMYLVGVNGHVYLLDGRQDKSYRAKSQGDYIYECYYWENVPVVCWLNNKSGDSEDLWFGTTDGRVCRFNTDMARMERYADDGAAILALWCTKADDDGDVNLLKTMIKRGNSVILKPYTRSSAQICFRTEKDPIGWVAAQGTMDIFDWEDVDFSRFTFNSNDAPREVFFNRKLKNYKRLQILIKNDAVNEGFGLYGITKHFVAGNFAKR